VKIYALKFSKFVLQIFVAEEYNWLWQNCESKHKFPE